MDLDEHVRRTGGVNEFVLRAYNVAELRAELKKRGIDAKGKKDELRNRLKLALLGGGGGAGGADAARASAEEAKKVALARRVAASKEAALQRRNSAEKVGYNRITNAARF